MSRRWIPLSLRLSVIAASALGLVILPVAAAFLFLQSQPGKRLAADWLATKLSAATGYAVDIGGLDGTLPLWAEITEVSIADPAGTWLTVDRLDIAWRPMALLSGQLDVTQVGFGEILLSRLPQSEELTSTQPKANEAGIDLWLSLPRPPLPVTLRKLAVKRLSLGPELLGEPASLSITGSATLGEGARDSSVELSVARLDGPQGGVTLQFGHSGTPAKLTLAATVAEPAGGLIARALDLPGLPPVSASLTGDGTTDTWRGDLAITAGDAAVDGDLSLALGDALALEFSGTTQTAGLLLPVAADIIPPRLEIALELLVRPEEEIRLGRLALNSPEARVDLSGSADLTDGTITGIADLSVADASRWQSWLEPLAFRSGQVHCTLSGKLDQPSFQLSTGLDGVEIAVAAVERVEASLAGNLTLRDRRIMTGVSLEGSGTLDGIALKDNAALAALIDETANWSVAGALDLAAGDLRLASSRIQSGGLSLEVSGTAGDHGRDVTADVTADLANIAPVGTLLGVGMTGGANLVASVSGDVAQPDVSLRVNGALSDFASEDARLATLLGRAPTVTGGVKFSSIALEFDNLMVAGAGINGTANGSFNRGDGPVDLTIAARADEIGGIAALFGIPATGRLASDVALRRLAGEAPIQLAGTAALDGFRLDSPVGVLLGNSVRAKLDGVLRADGIDLAAARIDGSAGSLSANGHFGDTFDLIYQLTLPRLAMFSAMAGVELAGSGTVHGKLTGNVNSPALQARFAARDLAVAKIALNRLDGAATARNLLSRPEGELNLAVEPRGQRLSLATRFSRAPSGSLSLNGIEFTAPRTRLVGNLAVSPAGMLDGAINGDVGDLRWVGSLIGLPLSGDANLGVSLKSSSASQELNARMDARDFAVAASDGSTSTAGQAAINVHVSDAFRRPRGSGELTVSEATLASLTVTSASLMAEGDADALRISLNGEGEQPRPFAVQANAEMAFRTSAQSLRLDVFQGNFGPLQAILNGPATFVRAKDGLKISELDVGIGEGRITGGGRIGERESDLAFALADLPLDTVSAFVPSINITGVVSGDLRFSGTASQPAVSAEMRFADLREAGTEASDAVGVDARIGVDLGGGRGILKTEFGGRSDVDLSARLDAPIRFSLRPFALELVDGSPLAGGARGNLDLALLPKVFDLRGDSLSGQLTTDIAVAGTLSSPILNGEARVAGGGYESAENGTVLREVTALVVGANDRIVLESFSATDGGEGRLSVTASAIIAPSRPTNYSGELTLQRFTLLRRRNCTAVASGRLKLDETEQGPQISGEITANSAEIRIPERLPNRIVSIEVVEVNVPASRTRSASAKPGARAGSVDDLPLSLDVTGIIPGNAFLRGRGIESEWRGELRVRGTLGTPDVVGKLKVVRGSVNLLGRLFRLEKGTVTFTGGDSIDPDLDIVATGQAADVTASIRIAGRASQPTVDVTSDSGLPQEEVISRILFGKGTGGLSPVQAALLAQSAPSLLGMSDTSLLGQLRSGTGLDVLTVESKDGSAASSTVVGGKYIDDDVFVRVEQGLTPESRNVGVEVRVLPKVILEGDVGGQGDGRVGVRFRHDY